MVIFPHSDQTTHDQILGKEDVGKMGDLMSQRDVLVETGREAHSSQSLIDLLFRDNHFDLETPSSVKLHTENMEKYQIKDTYPDVKQN